MFEPIGGTAPEYAGTGKINPLAAIGAVRCCWRSSARTRPRPRVTGGHPASRARRCARCGPARWASRRARSATSWWRGRRHDRAAAPQVELYDTTLRDGAQGTGSLVLDRGPPGILHKLDQLGVPFIEGGWPGANPRDTEFFRLATKETLKHATLTAFGMTRKAGEACGAERRPAGPARRGDRGRLPGRQGLGPPRHRGAAHGPGRGRGDGRATRSLSCAGRAAGCSSTPSTSSTATGATRRSRSGAGRRGGGCRRLVLCDTNGGMLPTRSRAIVAEVVRESGRRRSGSTCTTTPGCAVANSLIAVEHGAFQVQGVVNGYGERTGNADLIPIAANLVAEDGRRVPARRRRGTAHRGRALRGRGREPRPGLAPAVRGRYAFTHKAGLHASGVDRLAGRTSTSRPRPSGTGAASSRATSAARPRSG